MPRSQRSLVLRLQTWHAITQVHEHVSGLLATDLHRHLGLDLSWYELLVAVQRAGGRVGQRELLHRTPLSQSGLSRLLDRMAVAGLVDREHQPADRRQWDVVLAPAGAELLRSAVPLHNDGVQRYFGAKISDQDAAVSHRALRDVLGPPPEPAGRNDGDDTEGSGGPDLEPVVLADSVLATSSEAVRASNALAIRNALEPLVLEEAARHRDDRDVQDLHAILVEVDRGMTSEAAYRDPHWALHLRIAEITPNTMLRDTYLSFADTIHAELHIVIPESGLPPDFIPQRVGLHHEIVAAIAAGDVARCRELAAVHQLGNPVPSTRDDARSPR